MNQTATKAETRFRRLYTLGYTTLRDAAGMKRLADRLDATIVDIRYSPRSRAPQWSRLRLTELLGARYMHLQALGNELYKDPRGLIRLVNPQIGTAVLRRLLLETAGILVCACKDLKTCHRLAAAKHICKELSIEVTHLDGSKDDPAEPRLF